MFISFPIGDLVIRLESQSAAVLDGGRELLTGWPILPQAEADLVMQFELVEQLPAPPPLPPLHVTPNPANNSAYQFAVYQLEAEQLVLHTPGVGMILLSLAADAVPAVAGLLTPLGLRPDQLENLLIQPLASLLLRRDYHTVHSFTVARNGRAVLLVGQSMSGKTTTGLALLGAGWEFLGNDAALLQMRPDGVYALPFPGLPGIRPHTLELLPWLSETGAVQTLAAGWEQLDIPTWPGRWGKGAKVTAVYFPQISGIGQSKLERLPVSAALSQLLEQSVQKWDRAEIGGRLALWDALGQQITAYRLHLSEDLAQIPPLLK